MSTQKDETEPSTSLPTAPTLPCHLQQPNMSVFFELAEPHSHLPTTTNTQGDDNDESSMTQVATPEENKQQEELNIEYGILQKQIVGIQHYSGVVGRNEQVQLRREPQNQYDQFAIAVYNTSGIQVGHLPRTLVAVLSPLLDTNDIRVEGSCPLGGKPRFQMPIILRIFGREEIKEFTLSSLRERGLALQKPLMEVAEVHPELRRLLGIAETERRQTILDELSGSVLDVSKLSVHPDPPMSIISTPLLTYQLQGLAWCIQQEHPQLPEKQHQVVQFWKKSQQGSGSYYHHLITNSMVSTPPTLCRGGIMADDMGLGKTLTMLALIACSPDGYPLIKSTKPATAIRKPTLIVAPLSVVSNWVEQIENHSYPGKLSWYLYYGPDRDRDPEFVASHDIVITTYQIVSIEHKQKEKKKKTPTLQSIKWLRVILDEGHVIKSRRARQSIACAELQSERRWVVSGTPITNKLEDLYSIIRFLKFKPFDEFEWWNRCFDRPLKSSSSTGLNHLRLLMKFISIRRTKAMKVNGKSILYLPQCTVYIHQVHLSPVEYAMYSKVEKLARKRILEMMIDGSIVSNYTFILLMMNRLRQICNHVSLCPEHYIKQLSGHDPMVDFNSDAIRSLLSVLREAEEGGEECCVCLDLLKIPVITPCAHCFCRPCIENVIDTQAKCPLCRNSLEKQNLLELPPPNEGEFDDSEGNKNLKDPSILQPSTKIKALLEILQRTPSDIKSVVFSQWTSMLDLIEPFLEANGIPFVRFDGKMNRKKREEALAKFQPSQTPDPSSPPPLRQRKKRKRNVTQEPMVLLMSLKCGSVGLNLTRASQVFLMDPWWNAAIESQAMDRVYRLGQTRPVNVIRFVTRETIEERVMEIQRRKLDLVRNAFAGIQGANAKTTHEKRLQDIQAIFNVQ